jgi:hypothetical protein
MNVPTLLALGVSLLLLADSRLDDGAAADCDKCKPAGATWDWKANGYSLGGDTDAAVEAAKNGAIASGCKTSARYLDARKLKCKSGCSSGDLSDSCDASKPPKCTKGSYADDKGMWMFVCRKSVDKAGPKCDDELAKTQPAYGMCDVHVRAEKSLACSAPGC